MNKYIEKIATTRLVKELAKGLISKPLHELIHAGSLRSPGIYAKGMKKGNIALAKAHDLTFQKVKPDTVHNFLASSGGGYATLATKEGKSHIMHVDRKASDIARNANLWSGLQEGIVGAVTKKNKPIKGFSRQESELAHQAFIRHEIYEGMAINKMHPKGVGMDEQKRLDMIHAVRSETPHKLTPALTRLSEYAGVPKSTGKLDHSKWGPVGNHASLSVLARESNMIRENPYLHKSIMKDHRDASGEAGFISKMTGKKYGADKITAKGFKKLDQTVQDPVTGMHRVD